VEEDHGHLHLSDSRAFPDPVENTGWRRSQSLAPCSIAPGIQRKKPV